MERCVRSSGARPERASLRNLIEGTVSQFEGAGGAEIIEAAAEMDTALKGDVLIDVMRFRQIVATCWATPLNSPTTVR